MSFARVPFMYSLPPAEQCAPFVEARVDMITLERERLDAQLAICSGSEGACPATKTPLGGITIAPDDRRAFSSGRRDDDWLLQNTWGYLGGNTVRMLMKVESCPDIRRTRYHNVS